MAKIPCISILFALCCLIRVIDYTYAGNSKKPTTKQKVEEFKKNVVVAMTAGYTLHNELRARHNCVPLTRDRKLELKALKYADQLMKLNLKQLKPSDEAKKNKRGESLFSVNGTRYGKKTKKNFITLGHVAVNSWYSEVCLYDFDQPKVVWKAGRFTQLIWNKTLDIGMGFSYNPKNDKYIIVAVYKPRGNTPYKFEYAANVPCPKSLSTLEDVCKPESKARASVSCKASESSTVRIMSEVEKEVEVQVQRNKEDIPKSVNNGCITITLSMYIGSLFILLLAKNTSS